ncbi:MAG: DegV family protein [Desulfocapsaceae bacterium]|nr:DegV family protein [Desulfocapsaceae bacterium]
MKRLDEGFIAGYACLSARADLLDRINVFPVADSDTGVNLRISLAPLRSCGGIRTRVAEQLYRTATGNSGNIAASFFSEFLCAGDLDQLPERAARGREKAWQAVADPKKGTMLGVFDRLSRILIRWPLTLTGCPALLAALQEVVLATASELPDLSEARVVDAGALGMYVFFDGFFRSITGYADNNSPLEAFFPGLLAVSEAFRPAATDSHCVDVLIRAANGRALDTKAAAALGESVIVIPAEDQVKVHVHTSDPGKLREELSRLGQIVAWSDQAMSAEDTAGADASPIHIMTDAAGSLPRELARRHGISLLDSYVVAGAAASPESLCSGEAIYARMRAGEKVTTAQASVFERHQVYRSVCEQHGRTLYLCVGSAFTGNYETAMAWKSKHDADNLFNILDTGAASGRLGLIALLLARYARQAEDADAVLAHARLLADCCREYVFIDVLRYLVAGGRLSRAGGFVGDLLHMKPVISPMPAGVKKAGMVRNARSQLAFAEEKLAREAADWEKAMILLQYSDNREWVSEVVLARIRARFPQAEIAVVPLSLTAGVHMGPGTWAVAFGPVA